jgi:hypothetical protein
MVFSLAEFMQEMDGLTSSKENREKSLVVIGYALSRS